MLKSLLSIPINKVFQLVYPIVQCFIFKFNLSIYNIIFYQYLHYQKYQNKQYLYLNF